MSYRHSYKDVNTIICVKFHGINVFKGIYGRVEFLNARLNGPTQTLQNTLTRPAIHGDSL